ncbi:MAG: ATP-binding protein [Bacteroidia bacterium]|nr:ATP-binding protein [Bacteroidia bacterium]MBT8276597.1 ATP-binding protein [Bacteroidia bacterium]NNM09136.1 ATP-binding protein [Flavobacteriaceae bacterium]
MKTKRIVITGGPGSGKTTLVKKLEGQGFACMHEISRQITKEAKEQGVDQLFLENPLLFSEKLLEGRLEQFKQAEAFQKEILFYDRGMPDVTSYMDYLGIDYPDHYRETCSNYIYDAVFVLPPWPDIYIQDNERYESYDEAEKIFTHLVKGYTSYNYNVHEVPTGDVAYRIEYILKHLIGLH